MSARSGHLTLALTVHTGNMLLRSPFFDFAWLALSFALSACQTKQAPQSPVENAGGGGPELNLPPLPACQDPPNATFDAGTCAPLRVRNFSTEIAPLFNSCGGEVCHDFGAGAIANLIGVPEPECCDAMLAIDPGHPETSYLLRKLSGQGLCGGARMPLNQPPFSADDLQAVSDWICSGALTEP